MRHSPWGYLVLLLCVIASSGASCRPWGRSRDNLPPPLFVGPPTLEDVLFAVNTNSARVQQLYTENAAVWAEGMKLRTDIALERPRRFRLRAKVFVSPDLDLGSNDSLFWIWTRHDPEKAIYYAYHDQFVAHQLPIGPDWLIESLGLLQLDPAGQYEGPTVRPDQLVELRARIERNGRPYTRLLVIDPHGWILEQQVLDASGQRLAIARCSEHRLYPETGASLPHRIQVELPTAQLAFQLEVGRYLLNQLNGDPAQLFEMPVYEGFRAVNLSSPAPPPAMTNLPPASPRMTWRPTYRGLTSGQQN